MAELRSSVLLVGCGKMGGALLRGMQREGVVGELHVVEPSPPDAALSGVAWHASAADLPAAFKPDLIMLAVKPQAMGDVLPAYARFADAVFLSIAAGTTLGRLGALLGGAHAVVRSMPNLPASIGQGATVAVANARVSTEQRLLCERVLASVGTMAWVDDESLLDAVTALSGSGPAYVFALCEAMAKAGTALGLPPDLADQLARQTVIGGGALLAQADESAEALRRAVTSPKGTTEAALNVLLGDAALDDLLRRAMQAATERSRELAR